MEEKITKDSLKKLSINDIEWIFKYCIEILHERMSEIDKKYYQKYYGNKLKELTWQTLLKEIVKLGLFEDILENIKLKHEIIKKIDKTLKILS